MQVQLFVINLLKYLANEKLVTDECEVLNSEIVVLEKSNEGN